MNISKTIAKKKSCRCPHCGFRIRGKGHEEGHHHKNIRR